MRDNLPFIGKHPALVSCPETINEYSLCPGVFVSSHLIRNYQIKIAIAHIPGKELVWSI
jgi:hypothetical protein